MIIQAVLLAGGKGARLKPHTTEIPKPLVPVGGKSIIEILLERMRKHGITDVRICVNHLAHLIETVLADGKQLGMEIKYSLEDRPLSTVAPLKLIEDLNDHFIVANGDILTDLDFNLLFRHHIDHGAKLTVAVHRRINKIDYGVLTTDPQGRVTAFEEKPDYDFTVSMGIYVFSKAVLEFVPDDQPYGFDDLMLRMLELDEPVMTYPYDGYWMDIGRPDDYAQACEDVMANPGLLGG